MAGPVADYLRKNGGNKSAAKTDPAQAPTEQTPEFRAQKILDIERGAYDRLEPNLANARMILKALRTPERDGNDSDKQHNRTIRYIKEYLDSTIDDLEMRLGKKPFISFRAVQKNFQDKGELYELEETEGRSFYYRLRVCLESIDQGIDNIKLFTRDEVEQLKLLRAMLTPTMEFIKGEQNTYQFTHADYAKVAFDIRKEAQRAEEERNSPLTREKLQTFSAANGEKIARLSQMVRKAVALADQINAGNDRLNFSVNNIAVLKQVADTLDTMNKAIAALGEGVPLTDAQASSLDNYHFIHEQRFNDSYAADASPRAYKELRFASQANPATRKDAETMQGEDFLHGALYALSWVGRQSNNSKIRNLQTECQQTIPLIQEIRDALQAANISPERLKDLILENSRINAAFAGAPVVTKPEESSIISLVKPPAMLG